MTFLTAGHETTSNALSWAFYLLAQNPDAEKRLRAEVVGVAGLFIDDGDTLLFSCN